MAGTVKGDVVVCVSSLGKWYRLDGSRRGRSAWSRRVVNGAQSPAGDGMWALRGASFEIRRGEVVGLIGANGSGKSTLLGLIAGTLEATEGTVACAERSSAILELGSGFNAEFTGRENAILGAFIHGVSRAEAERRMPEVEAFSELGEAMDAPVRTYSTGMEARLAFAVAIASRPDALLLDEVLAVGDAAFRMKCLTRLRMLQRGGTAIVLASHDADQILGLCSRAIYLKAGHVVFDGNAADAVRRYEREAQDAYEKDRRERVRIERVRVLSKAGAASEEFEVGDAFAIEVCLRVIAPVVSLAVEAHVDDADGNCLLGATTADGGADDLESLASGGGERAEIRFVLPGRLRPGRYSIGVAVMSAAEGEGGEGSPGGDLAESVIEDAIENMACFVVREVPTKAGNRGERDRSDDNERDDDDEVDIGPLLRGIPLKVEVFRGREG